jgi:aspartate-semialdehyde dehydrogenase
MSAATQTQHRPPRAAIAHSPSLAVVGATGAVGVELIACLERRKFPLSRLKLLASPRSAGRTLKFQNRDIPVDALDALSLDNVDIALFSAGSATSRDYARRAAAKGTIVIDNSSAFRMDDDVPLVVPEINPAQLAGHNGVIANPNCTAIITAMALWPLHRQNPIRRIIAATYQAASGAGAAAMEELRASTEAYLQYRPYEPRVLPHPYAFNVFSHNTQIDPQSGQNDEEIKVARELRKIMGAPGLRVGVTCVRVPVLRAHTIAMSVEFENPITPDQAREILTGAPGVRVVDDRAKNQFPMPRDASGKDEVLVGRLRPDQSDPTGRSLALMAAGDQLLKGAALNAVQIAELLLVR